MYRRGIQWPAEAHRWVLRWFVDLTGVGLTVLPSGAKSDEAPWSLPIWRSTGLKCALIAQDRHQPGRQPILCGLVVGSCLAIAQAGVAPGRSRYDSAISPDIENQEQV